MTTFSGAPLTVCQALTEKTLQEENTAFAGTGGVSAACRTRGLLPAFRDNETGRIYLSRFADGRIAPIHVLEGLPDHLVVARTPQGVVEAIKASVVSGFVRATHFYTRPEAAALAV